MSKSINKVILVGNLTRDPETRYKNELAISKLGIATNNRRKDQESGEWRDFAEFHNITFFGKLAEIVQQYLKKGAKVYVEGRLQTSEYKDKNDGTKKYYTEVIANELVMLGGKQEGQQLNDSSSSSSPETPFPEDDSGPGITDDDIPFD